MNTTGKREPTFTDKNPHHSPTALSFILIVPRKFVSFLFIQKKNKQYISPVTMEPFGIVTWKYRWLKPRVAFRETTDLHFG